MELSPYVLYVFFFLLFAVIHSLTAASSFKRRASIVMGEGYKYYRISYNVLSVITFLPVIWISAEYSKYAPVLYISPEFLHFPLTAVRIACLIAAGFTFLKIDPVGFFGLKYALPKKSKNLETKGIYGIVRHPLYMFVILFLWTRPEFNLLTFLEAFLFTAYFIAGSVLEENKLIEEFGVEYRKYQKEVSMLFPLKAIKGIFYKGPIESR